MTRSIGRYVRPAATTTSPPSRRRAAAQNSSAQSTTHRRIQTRSNSLGLHVNRNARGGPHVCLHRSSRADNRALQRRHYSNSRRHYSSRPPATVQAHHCQSSTYRGPPQIRAIRRHSSARRVAQSPRELAMRCDPSSARCSPATMVGQHSFVTQHYGWVPGCAP